ncbi:response regulator [Aquicoccus sp. SCR17]|nr:response regulator [Carideicomes alvinocaridis]
MKILAVDDEPVFLEIMGATLTEIGYMDVHFAADAQEALEKISSAARRFDCFLLDIEMPGMNGIELLRRIRAMPEYRLTPIVMVTARTEKTFVDEAFMSGANDYVTKPIDKVEIKVRMSMVQSLLSERAHTGALAGQLADVEKSIGAGCDFPDAISLADAPRLLPYPSLENYLLKLGNLRLFSNAAVGFHVENAADIFDRAGRLDFIDMLTDVAATLFDAIGTGDILLSYAGSGDFVCVMPRLANFNRDEVSLRIHDGIAEFSDFYAEAGLSLPKVRVGRVQTPRLLPFGDPLSLVHNAIGDARRGSLAEQGRSNQGRMEHA